MDRVYHHARFNKSASSVQQAPADQGKEIAFAGRSNSGKSSAINAVTRQKALARTSKTPGRTQLINFFHLTDDELRLVDLPGYGYANVPEKIKQSWFRMMEDYFSVRQSLVGIILVMDVRHPLTAFDWQMLKWSEYNFKKIHILLTKADKLKYGAAKNTQYRVLNELNRLKTPFSVQLFSALKKTGVDELHDVLDHWFELDRGEMKKPSK